MNEKIDLTKILKDCPKGTKFYTTVWGEVSFVRILENNKDFVFSIDTAIGILYLTKEGCYLDKEYDTECIIFPSKDQRNWSEFKAPWYKKERFDPKTLKPFDKVLARIDGGNAYCWFANFVSTPAVEKYDMVPCIMSNEDAKMIIPYNDDTKHLVGTTEEAPEYYRYWED